MSSKPPARWSGYPDRLTQAHSPGAAGSSGQGVCSMDASIAGGVVVESGAEVDDGGGVESGAGVDCCAGMDGDDVVYDGAGVDVDDGAGVDCGAGLDVSWSPAGFES